MYPADSTLYLNDKEYYIESRGWNLLSSFWDIGKQKQIPFANSKDGQSLLSYIYNSFDEDTFS